MRGLRWLLYRLAAVTRRAERQRDLDAELQFHLDAEAEERRADGLAAAVVPALRAFKVDPAATLRHE